MACEIHTPGVRNCVVCWWSWGKENGQGWLEIPTIIKVISVGVRGGVKKNDLQ